MKKSLGWAYLFFALSLVGLAGLHTIYLGKTAEGGLFSACDLGRTLGPHPGAHSSFAEYPACHWSGIATEAVAESCVHHPFAKPAPGDWAAGPARYRGYGGGVDLFSLPRQTRKANEQSESTLR